MLSYGVVEDSIGRGLIFELEKAFGQARPLPHRKSNNVGHQFTGHPTHLIGHTRSPVPRPPPSDKPSIFQPITPPFALNHGASISSGPSSR